MLKNIICHCKIVVFILALASFNHFCTLVFADCGI